MKYQVYPTLPQAEQEIRQPLSANPFRRWAPLLMGFVLLFSTEAFAQSGGRGGSFGLGLYLGKPLGPTAEIWLSRPSALKIVAAWDFDASGGEFIFDYEYHFWDPFRRAGGGSIRFNLYCGIGGSLLLREGDKKKDDSGYVFRLFARVPFGFTTRWVNYPFDVFAEITPALQLYDSTKLEIKGGVGARFYF